MKGQTIFKIISLLAFAASLTQAGVIQTGINIITKFTGAPSITISEELEQSFYNTYEILKNPSRRIIELENGTPQVKCSGSWNVFNSRQNDNFYNADPMQGFLLRSEQYDKYQTTRPLVQKDLGPNIDEILIIYDQFAAGAKLADYLINYTPCRNELNGTLKYWYYFGAYQNQVSGNLQPQWGFWEYTNNLTKTISNSAALVNKCTYTAQTTITSMQTYFKKFTSIGNYVLSFVMNMVSQTQNLINVMNSIESNNENCDLSKMFYDVGRIIRYLTDVDPITSASLPNRDLISFNQAQLAYDLSKTAINLLKQKVSASFVPLNNINFYNFEQVYKENYQAPQKHKINQNLFGNLLNSKDNNLDFQEIRFDSNALQDVYKYYNTSLGFFNGTGLYGKPNSTWCNSNLTRYLELTLDEIPNDVKNGLVYESIYDISELMAKLYSLQSSCHYGVNEAGDKIKQYEQGYQSFVDFMDTFAFNFGLLYDSVLTGIESISKKNYFMSGYSIGHTWYLLFFQA